MTTASMRSPRPFYLAVALVCAGLLGYGYYLQFGQGLEPCPLCIFQRVAFLAVLGIALAGLLHGPGLTGTRVYNGLLTLAAVTGAVIAGRQVWLQHLPADQVPECGPGLDFMLEVFSLPQTIRMVFSGSGECAEVDWTFLSLSIAEWSLICFILLALGAVLYLLRRPRELSRA